MAKKELQIDELNDVSGGFKYTNLQCDGGLPAASETYVSKANNNIRVKVTGVRKDGDLVMVSFEKYQFTSTTAQGVLIGRETIQLTDFNNQFKKNN